MNDTLTNIKEKLEYLYDKDTANHALTEINKLIEELKFKGMAGVIDQQVALAESGSSVQDIICNLLREELRYRQERSLINRIRNARMPWDWTLNSFPFEQQPAQQF